MVRSINTLPSLAKEFLDNIEQLTGWKGSLLLGGPHPETGNMTTLL